MMKRIIILTLSLLCTVTVFSQETVGDKGTVTSTKISFDSFCANEAIYLIDAPSEKLASITLAGELQDLGDSATYLDYKIQLKEGETQYFKLSNSNKLLVAKSLYVLRLNYTNLKD